MLLDATKDFDKCCEALLKNNKYFIPVVKRHEKRHLVLRNLCEEILYYEKKFGAKACRKGRNKIIATVAEMFVRTVMLQKEQQIWSRAKRIGKEDKANKKKELQEQFEKAMIPVHDRE